MHDFREYRAILLHYHGINEGNILNWTFNEFSAATREIMPFLRWKKYGIEYVWLGLTV